MSGSNEVFAALKDVEDTRYRLKTLAANRPDGWLKEYAQTRMAMAGKMTHLVRTTKARLAAAGKADDADELDRMYTESRAAVNTHQAKWPVIIIDGAKPEYNESMARIEQAGQAVIQFIKTRVPR